jgi:hypothetical protein
VKTAHGGRLCNAIQYVAGRLKAVAARASRILASRRAVLPIPR